MSEPVGTDHVIEVDTESGLARLTWHAGLPAGPMPAILLLGHGAGGGITAPDLVLVAGLARGLGYAVGLVEQPYRVAGKRAPVPAPKLDTAFITVAQAARAQVEALCVQTSPLIVGGRSSGARVACRTAAAVGARGVLALAFPLRPPRAPGRERPTRLAELLQAGVPAFIVQGERDVFGSDGQLRSDLAAAAAGPQLEVSTAAGADHALRRGIDGSALTEWLAGFLR